MKERRNRRPFFGWFTARQRCELLFEGSVHLLAGVSELGDHKRHDEHDGEDAHSDQRVLADHANEGGRAEEDRHPEEKWGERVVSDGRRHGLKGGEALVRHEKLLTWEVHNLIASTILP